MLNPGLKDNIDMLIGSDYSSSAVKGKVKIARIGN